MNPTRLLALTLLLPSLAAAGEKTRTLSSAGWTISWSGSRAVATSGSSKISLYGPSEPADGCTEEVSGKVVSVVGTLVSLSLSIYAECEGAPHPNALTTFRTVDLARGGQPVALVELFEERAILSALLSDGVVQKALKDAGVPPPGTLKQLQSLDGGCEISFSGAGGDSFLFHHVKGDQVAVRVGLSHGCEVMRGNFTQLGLYLPVPQALQPALTAAGAAGTLGKVMMKRP